MLGHPYIPLETYLLSNISHLKHHIRGPLSCPELLSFEDDELAFHQCCQAFDTKIHKIHIKRESILEHLKPKVFEGTKLWLQLCAEEDPRQSLYLERLFWEWIPTIFRPEDSTDSCKIEKYFFLCTWTIWCSFILRKLCTSFDFQVFNNNQSNAYTNEAEKLMNWGWRFLNRFYWLIFIAYTFFY